MLKSIGNLFGKLSLGAIIRNISLDVDTLNRADGTYLRIIVSAFGYTLLDEKIKLSGGEHKKLAENEGMLIMENPVNTLRVNDLSAAQKKANKRLQEVTQ